MNLTPEQLQALAHRTSSRYRHGEEFPYQFNEMGIDDFATKLFAEFDKMQDSRIAELMVEVEFLKDSVLIAEADAKYWSNTYSNWVETDVAAKKLIELGDKFYDLEDNLYKLALQNHCLREAISVRKSLSPLLKEEMEALSQPNTASKILAKGNVVTQ